MDNSLSNKINGNFKGKDIISLDQFSQKDIKILFSLVPKMREIAFKAMPSKILAGKIVVLLFYEPSSRTFGSFSTAVKQIGGQTVEILNPQQFSSVVKGETFEDTIRVFEAYSDAIVLRHPTVGAASKAAEIARLVPIVNAGNGIGEHPTQALLDLYTIYEKFERLDNLNLLIAGDMLNGRTVHSLIRGLSLYPKNTVYLLSPDELRLSRKEYSDFTNRGIKIIEIQNEQDIPKNTEVWYWTRIQKERFENIKDYEKVKNKFVVSQKFLDTYAGKHTILMHPLPRVGEILPEVDNDPRAIYLKTQIRNGTYVRMALLALVLGKS
ncbi:MAG: aspartate carbamoyltransferase [Candidatus Levybacteria bacterium RIFCSPHIGHO2_02_FULL_37_13]|nr:MAG: aspartate carbamoyltransferase [Candidatus Levybacteria bacterium RIFCSPHIGHO2_02_FULL_37_13]